ncbi:MAG TPA: HNH endonuclease [Roseiflexaceae bacterium]|nr:HNH endonuclease [Roseiflexaceae bacterium]
MTLDYYKTKLAKLRVDTKPTWPAATLHLAPYKPFLLLSLMDLIVQRVIDSNLIRLNVDLMDAFDLYWTRIIGNGRDSNPVMPFNHLRSEGFWHLVDTSGATVNVQHIDRSEIFRRIKAQSLLARLDPELFALIRDPEPCNALRRVLIEEYFAPEVRQTIVDVGRITTESFEYSRSLLNRSRGRFVLQESPPTDGLYITEVRSTAFRRVVVEAYQHTCAVCGARIVTPEGRTAVAAAHIVPWSHSRNDDPRNGIALCGLHHWAFDQGLIGITPAYAIAVSPILAQADQHAAPTLALDGGAIYKPANEVLWPSPIALRWHINNIFRPADPFLSPETE